jgi:hypothetical protein
MEACCLPGLGHTSILVAWRFAAPGAAIPAAAVNANHRGGYLNLH